MNIKPRDFKILPHAKNAEIAILGAILIDPDVMDRVGPILLGEDFYIPSHRSIFDSMVALNEANKPIDLTTLENELSNKDLLSKIGGIDYLVELASQVPTTANAEHYSFIVKTKSRLRKVIKVSQEITSKGYGLLESEEEYFDWAGNQIYQAVEQSQTKGITSIEVEMNNFFKKLEYYQQNPDLLSGFITGYTDLDKVLGGFRGGDLIILAARPSMGKTSFALNIAENVAGNGIPTLVFSLEMNKEQLTKRFIASAGKIDLHKMRNVLSENKIDHDLLGKMMMGADKLMNSPIALDDSPGVSISTVRGRARQWRASKEYFPPEKELPGLIVIDYLQLMHGNSKSGSREQEVSDISRNLKALAREVDVPILCLSQLNRKVEAMEDKRPLLSHLRESGSIEQDADIIMFIHRPEYFDRDNEDLKGKAEVIIAKHRNGPTGKVDMKFIHQYTRFENAGGMFDTVDQPYEGPDNDQSPEDDPF
jgi:replicative DNA helicase